jgi:HEAT repeat protein
MKYSAIGLIALTVLNNALGQTPASLQESLDQFQAEQVFYKQLEIAKHIVALRDKRALPPLEGWLHREDRHLRGNVAFIFAGLKDKRGLATLCEILDDRSDRPLGQGMAGIAGSISADRWWLKKQIEADRYYAVHLLGELGDPAAIPVLARLRYDPEVGYKVPWALDQIRAAQSRAIR